MQSLCGAPSGPSVGPSQNLMAFVAPFPICSSVSFQLRPRRMGSSLVQMANPRSLIWRGGNSCCPVVLSMGILPCRVPLPWSSKWTRLFRRGRQRASSYMTCARQCCPIRAWAFACWARLACHPASRLISTATCSTTPSSQHQTTAKSRSHTKQARRNVSAYSVTSQAAWKCKCSVWLKLRTNRSMWRLSRWWKGVCCMAPRFPQARPSSSSRSSRIIHSFARSCRRSWTLSLWIPEPWAKGLLQFRQLMWNLLPGASCLTEKYVFCLGPCNA